MARVRQSVFTLIEGCNGVRRGGGLRCLSSYGGVQLYICVCGMRKDGSDSRTQLVAEWILARTKPLQRINRVWSGKRYVNASLIGRLAQ
jgi:hypothetical protein